MSRFLMFGSIWRAAGSIAKGQKSSYSGLRTSGDYFLLTQVQHRTYSAFINHDAGCTHSTLCRWVAFSFKHGFSKSYSVVHSSDTVTHPAQTVFRRLLQIRSCNGLTLTSIIKFAQAFSLASSRYQLLIPGAFAFIIGELALPQKACAESDYFLSKNAVYMRAEDGHAYMTTLFLAALEILILLLRSFYLSILFSPSIAVAPFADTFGPDFRKWWLQLVHRTLELAGPAFIKWGQWAATRPDLFPNDLCTELSELHTKAPEHSFAYTKKTVERAFSRRLSEIFESFDENAVASGSVAQVHRATLRFRYPGKKVKPIEVAVKVRHPGVVDSIRRDFIIINAVVKVSCFIPTLKWLRLDESVQQFAVFMMSQVDLSREAAHLNRFIYNFRRWRDVSFPRPLYPLVHPEVLVETYEHGESVAYYIDELEGHHRLKASLAHIGTHALLKMLLVDNFIHADMHPGNIIVRVPASKSAHKRRSRSKPHVVFIDVGMTAELSKTDQANLLEFFKSVATRDGRTAAECTLRLSKHQNCPDPEAFIKEVKESFDFWGTPEGDLVHPADCMHQVLEKVRRHKVNIDGNVCAVIVTTLVLEGWQRKLDPEYDVMHTLKTLLFKVDWAKSLTYTVEGLMAP